MNESVKRPQLIRRPTYCPAAPQEEFIVPLLRGRIETLLQQFGTPVPENGRVIDVGCGRQPFRRHLEEMGYSYAGMDVQQNPEGTVDLVCALDRPFPDAVGLQGQFHFVLCTEVLEHVADWSMAFANLKTLLAPGGRVLITCPHFYQLHEVPHDYWRPTLFALRHHAEQGRLKIVHEEAAGDAWDVLGTALGNCQVAKAGSRFLQRPFVPVGRWLVAAAFGLLKRRIPQRLFALHSPLYLSNIVVLEKPGSSGNMGGNGE